MVDQVLAVANQKGGVGRTTTTLGIARALVERGEHVVVIDADPQATATRILGVDPDGQATLADLLDDPAAGVDAAAVDTEWGISLVPGHRDLALRERGARIGDEFLLRQALAVEPAAAPPPGRARLVLIDCPPSLGLLTVSALVAAQRVLLVTEASFNSLAAVADFLDTTERVVAHYNAGLAICGVIVSKYRGTVEHSQHVAQLEDHFPGLVLQPFVRALAAAEAPASTGLPLSELRRPGAAGLRSVYDAHATTLFPPS